MIEVKPDFSRIRRALLLEGEPDRVPLYDEFERGIMSAWLGKPVTDLKTTIEFRARAGYDYVLIRVDLWSALAGKSGAAAGEKKKGRYSFYGETRGGTKEENGYTPLIGSGEKVWAREGKGVITTMKEFEEFPWPEVDDLDFAIYERLNDLMPHGMKAIAVVGKVFTSVWTLMGLETFSLALADDPGLVARLFERVDEFQYGVLDRVTRSKSVGGVLLSDDIAYTSGLMISPKHLRRYFFPRVERACALCRQRDLPVICHSDGKLDDVLDDIVAAGFNGLHPIQPNAMDIKKVKDRVGKQLCLLGNIDLDVLSRGTPEQVVALTRQNLREIAPGGGYCLGSSNSVPDYVKLENYTAMRDTAFRYGTYPIRVD